MCACLMCADIVHLHYRSSLPAALMAAMFVLCHSVEMDATLPLFVMTGILFTFWPIILLHNMIGYWHNPVVCPAVCDAVHCDSGLVKVVQALL